MDKDTLPLPHPMECYCNHCDTTFNWYGKDDEDIVCPRCGVGVVTKNGWHTHPANKVMHRDLAREIISWLGWRDFKIVQPDFASNNPDLRPIKRSKVKLKGT